MIVGIFNQEQNGRRFTTKIVALTNGSVMRIWSIYGELNLILLILFLLSLEFHARIEIMHVFSEVFIC